MRNLHKTRGFPLVSYGEIQKHRTLTHVNNEFVYDTVVTK